MQNNLMALIKMTSAVEESQEKTYGVFPPGASSYAK